MSRQLELKTETIAISKSLELQKALDYGLPGSIEANGFTFLGLTAYYRPEDCFIVLKVTTGVERLVSFVFAETLTDCVLKTVRMARSDTLRWKADKYQSDST